MHGPQCSQTHAARVARRGVAMRVAHFDELVVVPRQVGRGSVGGGERVEHFHDDGVLLDLEDVAGRQEAVETHDEVAVVVEEKSHAIDDVNLVDIRLLDVAVGLDYYYYY